MRRSLHIISFTVFLRSEKQNQLLKQSLMSYDSTEVLARKSLKGSADEGLISHSAATSDSGSRSTIQPYLKLLTYLLKADA